MSTTGVFQELIVARDDASITDCVFGQAIRGPLQVNASSAFSDFMLLQTLTIHRWPLPQKQTGLPVLIRSLAFNAVQ